ncbi:MAG: esterase family protein [Lachnospiraceae bacterium]|nr:esterase family protein [Lachnospiraceae bacterium]
MRKCKGFRKSRYGASVLLCALLGIAGCGKAANEVPTPNPTATEVPDAGPTAEPTLEATPEPTKAPTVTPEPTKEPEKINTWFDFGKGKNMENITIEVTCPPEYRINKADVTYGRIVKTSYYSETCEKNRNVIILLPEGYTEEKKYPVLYVLHGIFGDETSMIGDGNSGPRITVGNMIAKGDAKEMILVFPYMYASKTQDVCTAIDVANTKAYDNFVNDLTADLMPFMEDNYSVATGRENTAIIGFSMGGREAIAIGLMRPDLFGYIGSIAPAPGLVPGRDWAMAHPGQFAEEDVKFDTEEESPYVFMLCSGDNDNVVGTFPESYHNILNRNEVNHIWWIVPGSDHSEPAISSGIYNFCKAIFKTEE